MDRSHFVPQMTGTSAAGRVIAGGAVTLGLVMGFKEILSGFLPYAGESDAWWTTNAAYAVLLVVDTMAAFCGGILAGSGRGNAGTTGLLAGILAGATVFAMMAFGPGGKASIGAAIAAGLIIAVSVLGGWIGGKIWPPRTALPKATLTSRGSSILEKAKDLQQEEEAKKIRPTQWVRIILGVSLTICGFVAAETLRSGLVRVGAGMIDLGGTRNIPFSCMQIAGIIALLGGIASGVSTGAGFRHGVYVGLIAGSLAAGIFALRGPQKLPAAAGVLETLDWSPEKTPAARAAGAVFGAAFVVGSIGGLFGGLLFPPVVARPKVGKPGDVGAAPSTYG